MCEHEFIEVHGTKLDYEKNDNGRIETVVRRKVCWKCYKTKTEIELEQQLAAANARIAELEKDNARQKRLATISRLCKNVQACRAEKAEAQLDKMRNCGNCDNWRDCWGEPEEVPGLESCDDHKCEGSTYVQEALIHRMKRMENALLEIKNGTQEAFAYDKAKAALEEKP